MKRTFIAAVAAFSIYGCISTTPPPDQAPAPAADVGISIREEAIVLELEDRREWNEPTATQWMRHPSFRHRVRMALALGRIGTATFADSNGDGLRSPGERMAGVDLLIEALGDSRAEVRTASAFALGEIGDESASEALIRTARTDSDARVRSEAVEAFSKMAAAVPPNVWSELASEDQPAAVRSTALRFLFRSENEEALSNALDALDDADLEVRRAASYAFSRRPYEPARGALESATGDSDFLVRSYAIRGLERIGSTTSREVIVEALADIHPWVRVNAIRALATLATNDPAITEDEQASRDLIALSTASRDPDPGTRAEAIEALGHYADTFSNARTRLEETLDDPEPWFREQAMAALSRIGVNLLNVATTRGEKLAILRGGGGTMPLLRTELANDPDAAVRFSALGAIPDDQADAAAELILEGLNDPDVVVRSVAIDRAGHLSNAGELIDRVRAMERTERQEEANDARLSAIAFLSAREFPGRDEWLRSLIDDSDPVVRRSAADLIAGDDPTRRVQFTPLPLRREPGWYEEVARWAAEPHTAVIESVRGEIALALLTADAPITTWNFAQLANQGYFDGTSFMRVVPNFVIQGGDPRRDQNGGPGYSIRDEINMQRYTRGAVGMALSGPDTGGSQFFITHSPQPHLDGGYTVFARVVDGMTQGVDQMHRDDLVRTIRIDPGTVDASDEEIESAQRLALPLEIGRISEDRLLAGVPEYAARKAAYSPDRDILSAIASLVRPRDTMTIVLGTWCTDSQQQVPKMFSVLDTLKQEFGTEIETITIAVDRPKRQPESLISGLDITNVATFIYFRDGEEIGRIVETPRALVEDDLFAIVATP